MVIIEVETATGRIVAVIKKGYEFAHCPLHPGYVTVYELRQRGYLQTELVRDSLHIEHIAVNYTHEQVELEREIIVQPGFRQAAGFRYLRLACLLIIHLCENAQRIFKHFLSVGYHKAE